MTQANRPIGSSKDKQTRSDDTRAMWERPLLIRLAANEAEHTANPSTDSHHTS